MIRHVIILIFAACTAFGEPTSITLRDAVRLPSGRDVLVRDVAVVAGPKASELLDRPVLAGTVLAQRFSRGWAQVSLAEVRGVVNLPASEVLLRGSVCRVGLLTAPPATEGGDQAAVRAAVTGPCVLDAVIDRLALEFEVSRDDIRLTYNDRYEEGMRTPIGPCTVEVHPLGVSAEMPVSVTLYDGEKIAFSQSMRVRVEIRRQVAVVDRVIERRSRIETGQYHFESRWTSATDAPAATMQLEGAEARTALQPGQIILGRHVESPMIVKRGDLVTVRVLSGSIVAKLTARALSDARDGDRIQFEPINGGPRFRARMNGAGKAVLNSNQEH
ncbi:MAG: flagella basal body P-ring formation protein FlgA [Leptolyngbya sp. PLA3]|nr:MAG: flagella basal body P-ring formation protein FlgA [Cyanobacteria bacterium CYA]MCE7968143.1 flagella basal body P-ring formation protein FlgA [Leptolyngbya sp. PL-A3]